MGGKGGDDTPQQAVPTFQAREPVPIERAEALRVAQQFEAPKFNPPPEKGKNTVTQQPVVPIPEGAGLGDVLASSMNPGANYTTPEQQAVAAAAGTPLPLQPGTSGSV